MMEAKTDAIADMMRIEILPPATDAAPAIEIEKFSIVQWATVLLYKPCFPCIFSYCFFSHVNDKLFSMITFCSYSFMELKLLCYCNFIKTARKITVLYSSVYISLYYCYIEYTNKTTCIHPVTWSTETWSGAGLTDLTY